MEKNMRAVQFHQYGGPEVLQIAEVAEPVASPDEVLIDVKATTVNRLDLFQRAGSRPVPLPFTPGLEAAGIVAADNRSFHAGERVLTTWATEAQGGGGYASRIAVPTHKLVRIPDAVTFEQAAAAGLAASTAWTGLFDLGLLHAGEKVLIWAGTSGVGSIAIQLAKHAGAWVLATTGNPANVATLHRLGADVVVNYKEQSPAGTAQGGDGVHLVLDLVGTTLPISIDACTTGGRVVLIGNLGGQQATVDTQRWRLKLVNVLGGGLMRTTPENEAGIQNLIATQRINPLIDTILPVERAAEAHQRLADNEVVGKIVLVHEEENSGL
jgi:NADPH:quinone reductase-like Zn-dependent oxidoreductase